MFDLFDVNRNGQIEFREFVHVLGIFHPKTPQEAKIACKKYDDWETYVKFYSMAHSGTSGIEFYMKRVSLRMYFLLLRTIYKYETYNLWVLIEVYSPRQHEMKRQ